MAGSKHRRGARLSRDEARAHLAEFHASRAGAGDDAGDPKPEGSVFDMPVFDGRKQQPREGFQPRGYKTPPVIRPGSAKAKPSSAPKHPSDAASASARLPVATRKLIPLVISASPATWRLGDAGHSIGDVEQTGYESLSADKNRLREIEQIRQQVFRRDGHTCAHCGFTSLEHQEIHNLDDDHTNFDPRNLTTVCFMCHGCYHPGRVGENGEAVVVLLKGVSQGDINNLVRAIHVARHMRDEYAEIADRLWASLIGPDGGPGFSPYVGRMQACAADYAPTASPYVLGAALLRLDPPDYADRARRLGGTLIVHRDRKIGWDGRDRFPDILDYWVSPQGPFGGCPPTTWGRVLTQAEKAIEKALQQGAPQQG